MTYGPLGDSGLMVSAVGIGCNAFSRRVDDDGVAEILAAARDTGVTLLDTADAYGVTFGASETMLGDALEGQRDEFVIATKFGGGAVGPDHGARASRRHIMRAVEDSLRRLQTDHIDLYQLHVPCDITPIEETLSALTDLVHQGKVRYVGCSNFAGWQIADADWTARTAGLERFVSAQNRYSLLDRDAEDDVISACEAFGLGMLPYFPLEYGLLDGQVPPRRARPHRLAGRRRPGARAVAPTRRLGQHRGPDGVRRRARPHDPRRRDRRPRCPADRRVGDRRRDLGRPGTGQRGRAGMGADGGRPRRARRDHRRSGRLAVRRPGATASTAPSRSRRSPAGPAPRGRWPRRG